MKRVAQQPLSDDELDRLAARLADFPGAMSLEAVDGPFCALIAAPELTLPSDYLPVVLNNTSPEGEVFRDEADAQETIGLLMRCWNSIAEDFEREDVHLPYIEEPGPQGILGREWARGYMRGTRLSPEGWNRIFGSEREGRTLMIPVVAGEVDPEWPKDPLSAEKSEELLRDMIAGAVRAYRFFKLDRRAHAQVTARTRTPESAPFERQSPKVGRNDPCPCGSGKKYKRCCAAPDSGDRVVH